MKLPPWQPGLEGLIYLPQEGSLPKQKNRPYFIYYIDARGRLTFRDGPLTWTRAFKLIQIIAEKEGVEAFGCPEGRRYKRLIAQGYFQLKTEGPTESVVAQDRSNNAKVFPAPPVLKKNSRPLAYQENFDYLFAKWAEEAVQVAKFPAKKPQQNGRIPVSVKEKVARLWEQKICYPDKKPACFRIRDNKRGGPYSWFSYYNSNQTIYPNWEYFVQVAAFHDLLDKYGYLPEWLTFEYNESVPPVHLAVDIGIKLPDGRKVYVEVKENQDKWQALLAAVRSIGEQGVNLRSKDRGNDPLRKAKYIATGRPDFFVGYYPEGFDSYRVVYSSEGRRFFLKPSELPPARIGK